SISAHRKRKLVNPSFFSLESKRKIKVEELGIRMNASHQSVCVCIRTGPSYAVAPNLTDTSFDTPGSCMVTPYSTGAMLIVFLLWVMSTNCVCTLISFTSSVNQPTFASSSGASTSSRMQNGLG